MSLRCIFHKIFAYSWLAKKTSRYFTNLHHNSPRIFSHMFTTFTKIKQFTAFYPRSPDFRPLHIELVYRIMMCVYVYLTLFTIQLLLSTGCPNCAVESMHMTKLEVSWNAGASTKSVRTWKFIVGILIPFGMTQPGRCYVCYVSFTEGTCH